MNLWLFSELLTMNHCFITSLNAFTICQVSQEHENMYQFETGSTASHWHPYLVVGVLRRNYLSLTFLVWIRYCHLLEHNYLSTPTISSFLYFPVGGSKESYLTAAFIR